MATAMSTPANADSQQIGTVLAVDGSVQAQWLDSGARLLHEGSPIFLHDRIITGEDGMVSILLTDGEHNQLDLGRMSDVVVDEDVFQGSPGDIGEAAAEATQIQVALLAGTFELPVELHDAHGDTYDDFGHDLLVGNIGDDKHYGGSNTDHFVGGTGEDRLFGSAPTVHGGDDRGTIVGDNAISDATDPTIVQFHSHHLANGGDGPVPEDQTALDPDNHATAENAAPHIDTLVPPPEEEV